MGRVLLRPRRRSVRLCTMTFFTFLPPMFSSFVAQILRCKYLYSILCVLTEVFGVALIGGDVFGLVVVGHNKSELIPQRRARFCSILRSPIAFPRYSYGGRTAEQDEKETGQLASRPHFLRVYTKFQSDLLDPAVNRESFPGSRTWSDERNMRLFSAPE